MKSPDSAELSSLLDELQQGKERAFNTLYHYYFRPLYRKVYSMVKDETITDELIQELFLKIWQKHGEIDPGKSFEGYLYTIAHNLVYGYFRKIAQDQRLTTRLLLNATDYYLHSDELLEAKESRQILMKAIDQLSPQRKLVFMACKLEGKSYEETGRELGISIATVNSHMTQSLKTVREFILKNYKTTIITLIVSSAITSGITNNCSKLL